MVFHDVITNGRHSKRRVNTIRTYVGLDLGC